LDTRALDRHTIGELEQFLRTELGRLQDSLRAITQESRTAEQPGLADATVHAAETLHTEIQVALVDRRTQRVTQIQDALQRLSEGQFGFCRECGAFVGLARLRALPFAQRCRDCQGRLERQTRREPARAPGLPRERAAA
jgi:DnaK suppressor protein